MGNLDGLWRLLSGVIPVTIEIPGLEGRKPLKGADLLAKWRDSHPKDVASWTFPRGGYLATHLSECYAMALFLMDETPFGKLLHKKMALEIPLKEFRHLVLLAILLHDIGKGSSDFQRMLWMLEESWRLEKAKNPTQPKVPEMVWNPRLRYKQKYRHEWIGRILLQSEPAYRKWLLEAAGSQEYSDLVVSAVAGHHAKTDRDVEYPPPGEKHPAHYYGLEVAAAVHFVQARYHTPFKEFPRIQTRRFDLSDLRKKLDECSLSGDETRISMALKWCVILADTFGSMSARNFQTFQYREILQARIKDLFKERPFDVRDFLQAGNIPLDNLHDFQKEAHRSRSDLLIMAACGVGKTAASILAAADEDLICRTKLLFSVPVTSATSQLFLDYKSTLAVLRHSRSRTDVSIQGVLREVVEGQAQVDDIFAMPPSLDDEDLAGLERDFRDFEQPMAWTTPDQILGALTFHRKSVLWLLYMVQSQAIFDEIHAYDTQMKGLYLQFLKWFPGIRTIQMSASVGKGLEGDILERRPQCRILRTSGKKDDPSVHPRYRFHLLSSRDEAMDVFRRTPVRDVHGNNGTTWTVNLVADAQDVGREVPEAFVYHAKFPYARKLIRQWEVVGASRGDTPIRVVCTQIAEMSFDISAHTMISALCPISAIVQRAGRVNRWEVKPDRVSDVFLYRPESFHPYSKHLLDQSEQWVRSLEGHDLSQKEVVESFRDTYHDPHPASTKTKMADTIKRAVRQYQGSVTGILEQDIPAIEADPRQRPLYEFTFYPNKQLKEGPRYRHAYVVPWPFDPRLGVLKP